MFLSRKIIWIIVLVVGLALIFFSFFTENDNGDRRPQGIETPGVSETPTQTPGPNPTVAPTPTLDVPTQPQPKPFVTQPGYQFPTPVPRSELTGPAACQLSGTIDFINEDIYENKEAFIHYQNIDDSSRFIFWKVFPNDGVLTVGPNIFSQLTLPDGKRDVGLSVNKKGSVKSYTLNASVTYGVLNDRGLVENRESDCTGSIIVNIP